MISKENTLKGGEAEGERGREKGGESELGSLP